MNIDMDSEQSTQKQAEIEDKTPIMNQRGKLSPHHNSEM